jgi:phosphoglycolate phosphatase
MTYRLVIFDFDGTLADSLPWFSRVINDVADRYGFRRIEPHETDTLRGLGARELMHRLKIPAWKMPLIANHMRKLKARDIAETRLFDGVPELLRTLVDGGLTLALVSSNAEANVRAILGPDNAARFSATECGGSIFGKPGQFRRILRKTGFAADEAICIGDEIRDLEAARQADIAFGAVAWGFTRPDALAAHEPTEMFETVAEIARRLVAAPASHSPSQP